MRALVTSALLLGGVLLGAGCLPHDQGDFDDDHPCTDLFASVGVEVVDSRGAPVGGLEAVTMFEDTGQELRLEQATFAPGFYVIVDDSQLPRVSDEGEAVRFDAIGPAGAVAGQFLIGSDGCHVEKLDGPDRLIFQ